MPERVSGGRPSVPRTADFEERDLTPSELRSLILGEINSYHEVEKSMQRRPSLLSDGRGPSLAGIAPAGPSRVPARRVTESDESARTTEAAGGKAGSSNDTLLSPRPAAAGGAAGAPAKRSLARAASREEPREEAGASRAAAAEQKRPRR